MAQVGRPAFDHGHGELRGIAGQRSRLHLSYRWGVRAYLFGTGRRRSQRVMAIVGVVVDAGVWAVLRRTDSLLFGPRLAVDLIDVGASSMVLDGPLEAATLAGVPLAMEAGIRRGPLGFAVPAAHLAAMTALRKSRGQQTSPAVFGWQVMGAVMGNALSWYEGREHDAAVSRHARELPAQREAAWLAGQNAVALGADTVVDELARLEYMLGAAGSHPGESGSGQALRAWKASLASMTSSRAVYLGTVLSRWSRSRQSAVLAHDVQINLLPGEGSTIVSGRQARTLVDALDRLGLSGEVSVRVQSKSRSLPGDAIAIWFGHHDVYLPADPVAVVRPFDPAPLVVLAAGLWCLGLSSPAHGGAPWVLTVPAAATTLPLAWWSRRAAESESPTAAELMVLRSIAHGLVVALAATPFLSAPYDESGAQVFPATMTLLSASVLAARYEHTLNAAARKRVLIAAAASLGLSLWPARKPIRWGDLAVAAVELGSVYMSFNRVQAGLDRNAEALAAELAEQSELVRVAGYAEGRHVVIDLVAKAASQARDRLASNRQVFDAEIASQAGERLRMIDEMLATLS